MRRQRDEDEYSPDLCANIVLQQERDAKRREEKAEQESDTVRCACVCYNRGLPGRATLRSNPWAPQAGRLLANAERESEGHGR